MRVPAHGLWGAASVDGANVLPGAPEERGEALGEPRERDAQKIARAQISHGARGSSCGSGEWHDMRRRGSAVASKASTSASSSAQKHASNSSKL